jgi:hypothetical protein
VARLRPSFNLPNIFRILLVITFFINDKSPYLTISINGLKVSGNLSINQHKLSLSLKVLWLGKTLYLWGLISESLPPSPGRDQHRGIFPDRLLGAINTGGIFADRSLTW